MIMTTFLETATRHRVVWLCLLLLLPSPIHAADDPANKVLPALTAFGLRGVWAPDCYRPPSQTNFRLSIDASTMVGIVTLEKRILSLIDERHKPIEWMEVSAARIENDTITLDLGSLSGDSEYGYYKIDTYQRFGNRIRLMRSEHTFAQPKLLSEGYHLGIVTDEGFTPPIKLSLGNPMRAEPLLERCNE